jgi:hypothetical protein
MGKAGARPAQGAVSGSVSDLRGAACVGGSRDADLSRPRPTPSASRVPHTNTLTLTPTPAASRDPRSGPSGRPKFPARLSLPLRRTLKRAADGVGQLFGREGFVQETGTAFKNPTLSQ